VDRFHAKKSLAEQWFIAGLSGVKPMVSTAQFCYSPSSEFPARRPVPARPFAKQKS